MPVFILEANIARSLSYRFVFLPLPQSVVGIRKWVQENLHPQLQFNDHEPIFYQGILVIRKVQ